MSGGVRYAKAGKAARRILRIRKKREPAATATPNRDVLPGPGRKPLCPGGPHAGRDFLKICPVPPGPPKGENPWE